MRVSLWRFTDYLTEAVFVLEELDGFCRGALVPTQNHVLASGYEIVRLDGVDFDAGQVITMLRCCHTLTCSKDQKRFNKQTDLITK